MQVTEKDINGLSHTYEITVPSSLLSDRLEKKIKEIRPQIRLKGFRPGKVSLDHIRKLYGDSIMGDVIQDVVSETSQTALKERDIRPAAEPKINLNHEIKQIIDKKSDLSYLLEVDVMPKFEPADPKSLKMERYIVGIEDSKVMEAIEKLAHENKTYQKKAKTAKAVSGDAVVIDFSGKISGKPFEGGKAEKLQIILGSGRFIPGFEEQLEGVKAEDEKTLKVVFPETYPSKDLAGKEAEFEVKVHEVQSGDLPGINDAFAVSLGLKDLAQLKETMRGQIENEYSKQSRLKLKRKLLDALDRLHKFAVPQRMVDAEFKQIWQQVEREKQTGEVDPEDHEKTDEELKEDYKRIAERRVRLGLVLSETGHHANITVSNDELSRAVQNEVRQYPGKEKEIYDFYKKHPEALTRLRAPIYEEKVIDYILELAEVTDKEVDLELLYAEDPSLEELAAGKKTAKVQTSKKRTAKEKPVPKSIKSSPEKKADVKKKAPAKVTKEKK